ncbi:hypothetical protein ASG43_17575 [Aureimonas sp. Leaf454]|uniref:GNAT family N-acetyltransferase n=1 Tax=Aureimonas sp. Leaf454 TaxID=1736381 RepID=UPI0006F8C3B2|nr:GNAT family N-acetyltransferase [Aureimonas sp. Leaf454]KQT42100.1 hypothetical protein ASG43_17575 [Aureimonas sp. Leaf454]
MQVRTAETGDAEAMSRILKAITAATGRERPSDVAFVLSTYVRHPAGILCSVAVSELNEVVGFQSLIRAVPGNPYDVEAGGGIIGTHIDPLAHRAGIGKALFAISRAAAASAGFERIDAKIGRGNHAALRYYEALSFRTYREEADAIHKVFEVTTEAS